MRRLVVRVFAIAILLALLLIPLAHPPGTAHAQSESTIVRTITYRDLMLPDGPEPIENYYLGTAPIISADGSTAVYSITRPDGPEGALAGHIFTFDIASQSATEIDTTAFAPQLDISDDGSTVLSMHQVQAGGPRLVRIVTPAGARTVAEELSTNIVEAVLSGDGRTVFFVLGHDGTITGIDGTAGAGLWAVDSDGANLRHLVGTENVRPLMNANPEDLLFFSNYAMQIDAASSGERAVFSALNYQTGEYFAFTLDGATTHLLGGPYGILTRLAISGDGSTVLSHTAPFPYFSAPSEYAVSNFDGSNHVVLATGDKIGDSYEKGTMLNEDGSRALLGSTGLLFDTASGEAITLSLGCPALSGSTLPNLTMDGTGERFLYLSYDAQGTGPLTLLELNPSAVPTTIPVISDVSIDPAVVTAGDGSMSTITATIETSGESSNCVLALNGLINEASLGLGVANYPLVDDGTLGDLVAGDGTYTVNTLQAAAIVTSGPRTIRIKVESKDSAGYRSAVTIDVEPFAVEGGPPPAETPAPEATEAASADSSDSDEALDTDEESTSGGEPGDWTDWEGTPPAEECTAPLPTAKDVVSTLVEAAAAPPEDDLVPLQVDTESDVPAGDPVDAETTEAVLTTVRQLAACMNGGNPAFFGLFTPSGLATLFVYIGLPLEPLADDEIADFEANVESVLAEEPEPITGDLSSIKEIRDVRLLPDGRVLVISTGVSANGVQLGYLVLEEVDGRWLIDYIGVIGEPIEITADF